MSWSRLSSSSSEDVLKTSSRRLDLDEYVRLSLTSSEDIFKTSSKRLGQDQYIRLGHTSSRRLQEVFKASSKCLQDVFKTPYQDVFKTFSRRLQDVFKRCYQVKAQQTFVLMKTSWRHLEDVFRLRFLKSSSRHRKLNFKSIIKVKLCG